MIRDRGEPWHNYDSCAGPVVANEKYICYILGRPKAATSQLKGCDTNLINRSEYQSVQRPQGWNGHSPQEHTGKVHSGIYPKLRTRV